MIGIVGRRRARVAGPTTTDLRSTVVPEAAVTTTRHTVLDHHLDLPHFHQVSTLVTTSSNSNVKLLRLRGPVNLLDYLPTLMLHVRKLPTVGYLVDPTFLLARVGLRVQDPEIARHVESRTDRRHTSQEQGTEEAEEVEEGTTSRRARVQARGVVAPEDTFDQLVLPTRKQTRATTDLPYRTRPHRPTSAMAVQTATYEKNSNNDGSVRKNSDYVRPPKGKGGPHLNTAAAATVPSLDHASRVVPLARRPNPTSSPTKFTSIRTLPPLLLSTFPPFSPTFPSLACPNHQSFRAYPMTCSDVVDVQENSTRFVTFVSLADPSCPTLMEEDWTTTTMCLVTMGRRWIDREVRQERVRMVRLFLLLWTRRTKRLDYSSMIRSAYFPRQRRSLSLLLPKRPHLPLLTSTILLPHSVLPFSLSTLSTMATLPTSKQHLTN